MFFSHPNAVRGSILKFIAVIFLVFLAYTIGQFPLLFAVGIENIESFQNNPDFELYGINSNVGFLLMILMFICATLALWAGIKFLHKASFKSIIRPQSNIDYNKIFWAFSFWFMLTTGIELIMYLLSSDNYQLQFNLAKFLPLLVISILVLPIQTSFEELFFRGYLMQGIGRGTKSKLAALLITSIFFGLIHGTNPEVAKYGLTVMMSYYISAGLALGIMTIMDDGLELALGLHAATNIYGALIVSYEGSAIQTDSIFKTSEIDPVLMLIISLVAFGIFIFVAFKKYNWDSLKKLTEKVDEENIVSMP